MTTQPTTQAPSDVTELAKNDNNLVWLDCEMSGLDPERERLLEIAIVVTGPNLTPRIEGPVVVVHQSDALLAGMDAWNKGTHGKSGLIDKVKSSVVTEAQAEELLIEFGILESEENAAKLVGKTA
jgi:oligoribonuclease